MSVLTDILGKAYRFPGTWAELEPKLINGDIVEYEDGHFAVSTNYIVRVQVT